MYFALACLSFQRQLTYRTANLAGLITNAFFGLLRASVLIALFGARESVAGYSLPAAVTFTGLTQALIAYIALWGWWDVVLSIRSGEIATDLARPLDLFWQWWARDLGRGLCQLLLRGLPMLFLYTLFYNITLPPTWLHGLILLPSLMLALFVSFAWRFLISLSALWTLEARGIGRISAVLITSLSGFLMPLAFFPSWATGILRLLPFAAMVNAPVEVYLGVATGPDLLRLLALQAIWALALLVLCRLVLAAGIRRLVIQGG